MTSSLTGKRTAVVCTALGAVVAIIYSVFAWVSWPTLKFSPDSWSYLELAQSFSSETYRVWTIRSFWSQDYSAAFPFGYPVLLHLLHTVFGVQPALAVVVNLVAAALIPALLSRLGTQLFGTWLPGLLAGFGVLLYLPFVDEIFGGRAMPVALVALLAGLILVGGVATGTAGRGAAVAGGFCVGIANLFRFDLALMLPLVGCLLYFRRSQRVTALAGYAAGGLVALAPWIAYSVAHFGKIWATDNSWVALAAVRTYVTSYPAHATQTLWTDPGLWANTRMLGVAPFARVIASSLARSAPMVAIAGAACLVFVLWARGTAKAALFESPARIALAIAGIASVALVPQIATGYFDARYLTLFFGCWALFLAGFSLQVAAGRARVAGWFLFAAVAVSGGVAGAAAAKLTGAIGQARQAEAQMQSALHTLATCHAKEPEKRYLINDADAATRYGAVFHKRASLLPVNFRTLSPGLRAKLEADLAPVRRVDFERLKLRANGRQDCAPDDLPTF